MPPASNALQLPALTHDGELATISDSLVVLAKTTRQLGEFTGRLADRMGRLETKLDALVEKLTRSAATQTVATLATQFNENGDEVRGGIAPALNSNGANQTSFPLFSHSQNSAYSDPPLSPRRGEENEKGGGGAIANAVEGNSCDDDVAMDGAAHLDADVFADVDPSGQQQQQQQQQQQREQSHSRREGSVSQDGGAQNCVVRVQDLMSGKEFNDFAHFLVDATGILNHWKWPDVPGLQDFKGDLIHSANWPKDFDYHDKVVAVIGNGSSGVQIVPAIRPDVKHLFHFVRSPTWIVPPRIPTMMMGPCRDILSQISLDKDENFTPETIERFKKEPEFYRKFVKTIEKDVNSNFRIFVKDSPMQAFAISKVREYMTAMLGGNEELCRALIPDFALGCRRMTPAPGYLECFQQPNMSLVTDNIARFVPEGIQTESGEIIKLDAIICATGFDLSFCPRFPIIGRNGNLQDKWTNETPKAYMSCAVAGMPNYFTFLGPNAPIAHGSVFTLSEHIAKYIVNILKKCQTESIKSIVPSQGAVDDFFEHITTFMPRTTWAGGCKSWFKNGTSNGPVTAVHPGSRIHFFHMLDQFRGEDWEYVYDDQAKGNRFSYLGNGFSTKELDEGFDSTWYLDEEGALGGYQIHALRKALL